MIPKYFLNKINKNHDNGLSDFFYTPRKTNYIKRESPLFKFLGRRLK